MNKQISEQLSRQPTFPSQLQGPSEQLLEQNRLLQDKAQALERELSQLSQISERISAHPPGSFAQQESMLIGKQRELDDDLRQIECQISEQQKLEQELSQLSQQLVGKQSASDHSTEKQISQQPSLRNRAAMLEKKLSKRTSRLTSQLICKHPSPIADVCAETSEEDSRNQIFSRHKSLQQSLGQLTQKLSRQQASLGQVDGGGYSQMQMQYSQMQNRRHV